MTITAAEAFAQSLTAEEDAMVAELAAAVAPTVQTSAAHIAFCTKGTYVRYLRARSWNVHKATRMLEETLKWRDSYRPDELTWDDMESEAARGKVFVLDNVDREGRPVVFMRPRKEVYGGDNDMRVRWVVYVMESASRVADAHSPDGKMTWLIDFGGYNRKNQPPWRVSMQTLQIVQNHYPERLGRAVNFQPPFLFELFYKAIKPFVDPVTRDKLVFLHKDTDASEGMAKQFDLQYLDETICGALPEDGMWNFEAYREKMKEADIVHKALLEEASKQVVALESSP